MRIVSWIAAALLTIVLGFGGYLGWRVLDARARTPALMAAALADVDPQIASLSQDRIDILLTVEDPTFWTNDGLDFETPGQGLTTLSQGLAKRLYFDPLDRKSVV